MPIAVASVDWNVDLGFWGFIYFCL